MIYKWKRPWTSNVFMYRFGKDWSVPSWHVSRILVNQRIRGGVMFLTQAWVLLKWKSTQLYIIVLWLFYVTKTRDYSKFLLSCQIEVKIKQGKSTSYYIWTWVNFHLSSTQAWVRNSAPPCSVVYHDIVTWALDASGPVSGCAWGRSQKISESVRL